jgi:hypothetical protein
MSKTKTKAKEDHMDRLNFTCPAVYVEYVKAVAEVEKRTVSGVLRLAIDALAEARGEEGELEE